MTTKKITERAIDPEFVEKVNNGVEGLKEVTSQLAQTAKFNGKAQLQQNVISSDAVNIGTKKVIEPLITFVDDDGYSEVMTRLKPIFESKGVPCTVAIVSDWVGNTGRLNKEQILELQNLGWEVASHSKTHLGMNDITDPEIVQREVTQSKIDLLNMGFYVKNYVYPGGQSNSTVIEEVSKHYKIATSTTNVANNETNKIPITNYGLRRVALGSFTTTGTNTLEHYKAMVDKAISENSWLIFMTHIWAQDATQDQYLADTIDYIKSKNVKIVNLDDGLNYFGDKININGSLRILPDDTTVSDKFVIGIRDTTINTADKANDMSFILSKYRKNNIIFSVFAGANATGMPEGRAGILTTYLETTEVGYIKQTFKIYNFDVTYERVYKVDSTWTNWKKRTEAVKKSIITPLTSFTANETKVLDIDISGMGANTTLPIMASCRNAQIDNFSYNIRISSPTVAKLRITNLLNSNVSLSASDWDLMVTFNS